MFFGLLTCSPGDGRWYIGIRNIWAKWRIKVAANIILFRANPHLNLHFMRQFLPFPRLHPLPPRVESNAGAGQVEASKRAGIEGWAPILFRSLAAGFGRNGQTVVQSAVMTFASFFICSDTLLAVPRGFEFFAKRRKCDSQSGGTGLPESRNRSPVLLCSFWVCGGTQVRRHKRGRLAT